MKNPEIVIAGRTLKLSPLGNKTLLLEIADLQAVFLGDLTRLQLKQDALTAMGETMDRIRRFLERAVYLSIQVLQPDFKGTDIQQVSSAVLASTFRHIVILEDANAAPDERKAPLCH